MLVAHCLSHSRCRCMHAMLLLLLLPFLQGSVQQQLEALLDLSPVCAPARLEKQQEINKQLMAENLELRRQLDGSAP